MSKEQRGEISRLLDLTPKVAPFLLVLALASLFFARYPFPIVAIGFLLVGLIAVGLLFFSWRHYNYWWSWAIWAVPSVLLGAVLLVTFVLPLVRVGALHPLPAMLGLFGLGGLGFFGPLFLLRRRIRLWFGL